MMAKNCSTLRDHSQLVALTACRSGEVRGAVWSEIDLASATWVIAANRMKARREHRIPLTPQAVALLKHMREVSSTGHIFPGRNGKALSDMALTGLLRRMGRRDFVPHGLRTSFRSWCAECTAIPREIAELCLAHTVGDAVERSYQRSDLLERRRGLLREWASYCDGAAS